MGRLHAREQEAVDLLYYLWKAYKAAPDDEFVVYIKELKSQCDDGLQYEPLRPSSSRDGRRIEHASSAQADQL